MAARPQVTEIHSRDNAFVKELRRLSQDSTAYRKQAQVWLEGIICRAALARGLAPKVAVFAQSVWPQAPEEWVLPAGKVIVLADALFDEISSLESPARMGYVMDWDAGAQPQSGVSSVVLDRVQDAGNVGSILRSASAFGFKQIVALKERRHCGARRCCVLAWGRILACIWWRRLPSKMCRLCKCL